MRCQERTRAQQLIDRIVPAAAVEVIAKGEIVPQAAKTFTVFLVAW